MSDESEKAPDLDITEAIQMMGDNVLVKKSVVMHVTAGGLFLPTQGERQAQPLGEVIAVGEGRFLNDGTYAPLNLKKGDKVIYMKAGGKMIDSTILPDIFMLRYHEIVAKIPEELWAKLTEGFTQALKEPRQVDLSPGPKIQVIGA